MVRLLSVGGVIIVLAAFIAVAVPLLRTMPETPLTFNEPSVLEAYEFTEQVGGAVGNFAPEFTGISQWINSEPVSIEDLRGKVVLIDFWTYTCVNCIRTMPFLRDWQAKYADLGLTIIGVHTPEFDFEKITENVRTAANDYDLEYAVAQDNEFGTWREYSNQFWPAKYLIDSRGLVRYTHFGEGGYDETELAIRELLRDAGARVSDIERNTDEGPVIVPAYRNIQDPAEQITRELYGGWNRNATPNGIYIAHASYYDGALQTLDYVDPGEHVNQFLFLQGPWTNELESIKHGRETQNYEDYIALKFFARSANIVIDLEEGVEPFKVKVTIYDDGERPLLPEEAGADIVYENGASFLNVDEGRMYFAVSLPDYGDRELRFSSNSPDFGLFAMTFGAYADVD